MGVWLICDGWFSVLVKAWNLSLWGNGSGGKVEKAGAAGEDRRKGWK